MRLAGPDGTTPKRKLAMITTPDGTHVGSFLIEKGRGLVLVCPGAHRVHLHHEVPLGGATGFTVASLGRTDLSLTIPASVPRRFVIEAPDDGEDLRVDWRCESGGRLLCAWQGFWKRHANPVQEVSLAFPPGDYRVVLTDHAGRRATAEFEVAPGETGGDPIRLDLR